MQAFWRVIFHYILIIKKYLHAGITLSEIYLKGNIKDVCKNLTRMFITAKLKESESSKEDW